MQTRGALADEEIEAIAATKKIAAIADEGNKLEIYL